MKIRSVKTQICAAFTLLFAATLYTQSATAYTVYQLDQDYYAIVCEDGQIFSYSGGSGGLSIVGPALCEGHGGIAGGGGGGIDVAAAPAQLKRAMNSCKGGKQVARNTTACKARVRPNRWETARQTLPAAKPATSHNASRSNRTQGVSAPDTTDNHNTTRSDRTRDSK